MTRLLLSRRPARDELMPRKRITSTSVKACQRGLARLRDVGSESPLSPTPPHQWLRYTGVRQRFPSRLAKSSFPSPSFHNE